jgi:nitrite reductase/ring-hydroxylating ferredoxin subunit
MNFEPTNLNSKNFELLTGKVDPPGQLIFVCLLKDLPPGHKKMVETPYETVLVVNVNHEFYAVSNICPHAGGYLSHGELNGYIIDCPLHYWTFDVRSGKLVDMNQPSLDDMDLQVYQLEIIGDEVYLHVAE